MKNNMFIGSLMAIFASASWGAMFPVAEHAFQYISPFYFTIIRYIPVAVILVMLLYFIEGKRSFKTDGNGFRLWFFGTMGFTVYNLFIFWGQNLLGGPGVLLASIMEALAPIVSILIVWFVKKSRPHAFTMFCIVAAFIGVLLVVTNGDFSVLFGLNRLFPLVILLLAAVGWAIYTFGGNEFNGWSVLRFSALSSLYGTITATIVVTVLSIFGMVEVPTLHEVYMVRYDMLFMIFIPGLLALLLWNKGVEILKPINAILFINFAPVTTIIIRMLQGYPISVYEFSGAAIVCLAIVFNNVHQRMLMSKTSLVDKEQAA
ncbi:MAG: DMT family transporter [Bacilli bacterium]|nr:DMT family transporter [Bacilli bacterium]